MSDVALHLEVPHPPVSSHSPSTNRAANVCRTNTANAIAVTITIIIHTQTFNTHTQFVLAVVAVAYITQAHQRTTGATHQTRSRHAQMLYPHREPEPRQQHDATVLSTTDGATKGVAHRGGGDPQP